ncbi:LysM peptidoglycan-binding domain-containing protein [Georgenia sp. SYP-B2076]|uniref:LysM peptidoglycan-binding domain-containing protein n=1 Tax=Georgenia sp. SYP-B2076 TaxID=2495881 RepID=UPI000F8F60E5|nr:hypothetical protein [Georgenia sp. SYP-B2076]
MKPRDARDVVGLAFLAGVAGVLAVAFGRRALETAASLLVAHRSGVMDAADLADVVALVLLATGATVGTWYALTAGLALAVPLCGGGRWRTALEGAVRRWGAPVLRRVVLSTAAAGMGVSLTLTGAVAATVVPDPQPTPIPVDLGWGPPAVPALGSGTRSGTGTDVPKPTVAPSPAVPTATPSPAVPTVAPPPAVPTADGPASAPRAAAAGTHVVTAGESLWSIAASALGPGAAEADIVAAWPLWYETNRALVGPDPDLIHPGQLLRAPTEKAP